MSILVLGVNHRACPLSTLERVRIGVGDLPKVLATLVAHDDVREAVVLSTCHRTEVYVVAERFHAAHGAIRNVLVDHSGLAPDDLHPHLTCLHDEGAVKHLFRVVSGLDSLLIGESEILGQVRRAWTVASGESTSGATLNLLFRHAVETGKRVRTETRIGRATTSLSHAAVELAGARLGELSGKRVLVLGAGEMGQGIVGALVAHGVIDLAVANRDLSRSDDLVARTGGRSLTSGEGRRAIGDADLLLTALGADAPKIDRNTVEAARRGSTRPLLIIDIAVPRNVDGAVAGLAGVQLLDLDDLRAWVERGRDQRFAEVVTAEAVIAEAAERFTMDSAAREAAPLVAQLHRLGAAICAREIERHARSLAEMDHRALAAMTSIAHGVAAKLLHQPSVCLKRDAGTPSGARNAAAIRDLFALGDQGSFGDQGAPASEFLNLIEYSMVSGVGQESAT